MNKDLMNLEVEFIALGFSTDNDLVFVDNSLVNVVIGSTVFINTYYLIKKFIENRKGAIEAVKNLLSDLNSRLVYIESCSPLNQCLIKHDGMRLLQDHEIDFLKQIICSMHGLTINRTKLKWVHELAPCVEFDVPGLYIRYGSVELRAIESYIRHPEECFDIIKKILLNIDDNEYIYRPRIRDDCAWYSSWDTEYNILALMTNAGFYLSKDSGEAACKDFVNWASKYLSGLELGYLFLCPTASPFFFNVYKYLIQNRKFNLNQLAFPAPEQFFKMLINKNVLIVSPFKNLLERIVDEERLKNLYNNFSVEETSFIFLEAPVSTYPNRPDFSWTDSYDKLVNKIDQIFTSNKIDIFIGSCGCYGIPLAKYVYDTYGCTSVYYGNWLNTLMGIKQKSSRDWGKGFINDSLRLDGDLAQKYSNMHLIDGGSYL